MCNSSGGCEFTLGLREGGLGGGEGDASEVVLVGPSKGKFEGLA